MITETARTVYTFGFEISRGNEKLSLEYHYVSECQLNLERNLIDKVNVYSRQEFMKKFMAESDVTLSRKERQALTHSSST